MNALFASIPIAATGRTINFDYVFARPARSHNDAIPFTFFAFAWIGRRRWWRRRWWWRRTVGAFSIASRAGFIPWLAWFSTFQNSARTFMVNYPFPFTPGAFGALSVLILKSKGCNNNCEKNQGLFHFFVF